MLKLIIVSAMTICSSCTWMQTHPQAVKEIEQVTEEVAEATLGEPGKLGVEFVEEVIDELDKPKSK